MSDPIETKVEGGVLTITINRPEKKNALTVAMYESLVRAMRGAQDDKTVRVVMLKGSSGIFTSGNDVADFVNTPPAGLDSPVIQFLIALIEADKPVICAIQGPAIGIGATMLLHCDLIYADETARFRLPFVDLGLCPEGASSYLLPRLMGPSKAAELLYFSSTIDAATARSLGLITDVLPSAGFLDAVRERANALAAKPPAAVRATKELLKRGVREAVMRALEEEGVRFLERLRSEEAMEAFSAFLEKRKPDFSRFS